jgi:cytochrome c2
MPDAREPDRGNLSFANKGRALLSRMFTRRNIALTLAVAAIALVGAIAGVFAQRAGLPGRALDFARQLMDGLPERSADVQPVERNVYLTALLDVEEFRIPLGPFGRDQSGQGGSIVPLGDGLLVVEPKGRLDYVSLQGSVQALDQRVPMNTEALLSWMDSTQSTIQLQFYRTLDSLIVPDGAGGQRLLVSHHRFNAENTCVEFVISEIGIGMEQGVLVFSSEGWRDAFVANWCVPVPPAVQMFSGHEAGGRMIQHRPGRILVAVGFMGFDGILMSPAAPQNPQVELGKIVEIDLATGRANVMAQGLRNPQGLAQDSLGRIWSTEHGPSGGDELNLIRRGRDYGFPSTTFGMQYGHPRADWPNNEEQGRHDRAFEFPEFFFAPSIGISNLVEAPAQEFPLWQGDLLVASLLRQTLYRMRLDGDNVLSVEGIDLGARIRDIVVLPDGALALLMDYEGVRILRRARGEGEAPTTAFPSEFRGYASLQEARAADAMLGTQLDDVEYGRRLFAERCSSCHSLDNTPGTGPTLARVIGRDVASVRGFQYSRAMQNAEGAWTRERLQHFLANPQAEVPGTTMPNVGPHYDEVYFLLEYIKEEDRRR